MKIKSIFLVLFQFWGIYSLFAQDKVELANRLFEQNEFSKAEFLYEDLTQENPTDFFYYDRYIECLTKNKDFKKAVKFIRKRAKKATDPLPFMVDEIWVNKSDPESQNQAESLFQLIFEKKIIPITEPELEMAFYISGLLEKRGLISYTIKIFNHLEETFGSTPEIAGQLARLYLSEGLRLKAMEKYLDLMINTNVHFEQLKQIFDTHLTDSADYVALQKLLIEKIQNYPYNVSLSEWLKWTFIKLQDWPSAFIYTKSLDLRLKEDGRRVFELGELCKSNQDLETALKCFNYCVSKGELGYEVTQAEAFSLQIQYEILKRQKTSPGEWAALISKLETFQQAHGPENETLEIAETLAQIYIENASSAKAVQLLENYINPSQLDKIHLSKAKIALAKSEIANNEMWKSELLLAQVEKDNSEDILGQWAKYLRAELSFFRGDYDWANMQLDVLKDATTQLISNDAMELSLCITDNLATDSNYAPLNKYSKTMLFFRQHQLDSALISADEILKLFPGHSLTDEVLMLKGKIYEAKQQEALALSSYETIIVAFPTDILADNALISMARIYRYKLNDNQKAMEKYKLIIEKYSNSIFISEARKEFRKIRGF